MSHGVKCGQRVNLFMKNIGEESEGVDYSASKVEIFLWLGNSKFAAACWSSLPAGYEVMHYKKIDLFPRSIIYTVTSVKIDLKIFLYLKKKKKTFSLI